jgi:hypothetical protein
VMCNVRELDSRVRGNDGGDDEGAGMTAGGKDGGTQLATLRGSLPWSTYTCKVPAILPCNACLRLSSPAIA